MRTKDKLATIHVESLYVLPTGFGWKAISHQLIKVREEEIVN